MSVAVYLVKHSIAMAWLLDYWLRPRSSVANRLLLPRLRWTWPGSSLPPACMVRLPLLLQLLWKEIKRWLKAVVKRELSVRRRCEIQCRQGGGGGGKCCCSSLTLPNLQNWGVLFYVKPPWFAGSGSCMCGVKQCHHRTNNPLLLCWYCCVFLLLTHTREHSYATIHNRTSSSSWLDQYRCYAREQLLYN